MSADEFHVHGPHDHEVEHAAHVRRSRFPARIAVMTAIFATIGALFGYMVGATQNDALLFKNDSAIRKTEASDQWNFYQAKSSKQNLAELGAVLAGSADAARFKSEAERYNKEKQEILVKRAGAREAIDRARSEKRSVDARPSPLGAGDDADPDRDRAGGDHAADAKPLAAVRVVWRRGNIRGDRRPRAASCMSSSAGNARPGLAAARDLAIITTQQSPEDRPAPRPGWRNGRRSGLKIRRWQQREGSTPSPGTR